MLPKDDPQKGQPLFVAGECFGEWKGRVGSTEPGDPRKAADLRLIWGWREEPLLSWRRFSQRASARPSHLLWSTKVLGLGSPGRSPCSHNPCYGVFFFLDLRLVEEASIREVSCPEDGGRAVPGVKGCAYTTVLCKYGCCDVCRGEGAFFLVLNH